MLLQLDLFLSLLNLAFILDHKVRNLPIQLSDLGYVAFVELAHPLEHCHSNLLALRVVIFSILRNLHELINHRLLVGDL